MIWVLPEHRGILLALLRVAYHHAMLALLTEGPSTAWELQSRVIAALGEQFELPSKTYAYKMLTRLQRDGLVAAAGEGRWTASSTVQITDTGRAELDEWLAHASKRAAGYRDDFGLKILAAALRGPGAVREICSLQREARLTELMALHTARQEAHDADALSIWTLDLAITFVEAEMKTIASAEALADKIVADLPLVLATPKSQRRLSRASHAS